jgi:hypothetical protein
LFVLLFVFKLNTRNLVSGEAVTVSSIICVLTVFNSQPNDGDVLKGIFGMSLNVLRMFMLQTVTWILLIGCLAAVAVSAPTSDEDSSSE